MPGSVTVLFLDDKYDVLGMAGPVEARVVVEAGAAGGVAVRLEAANGSVVVFEIDDDGAVYVVLPGSGERVRVGWGVAPLYAPRPGVAAPVCLPRVWGEYLNVRLELGEFVEYVRVTIRAGEAESTHTVMAMDVRGPLLARSTLRLGGRVQGGISVDVPVLSAVYVGGVAVDSSFLVKAGWLGPGVRVPEGAWVVLVGFEADLDSIGDAGYLMLPWWPAMIAASLVAGGLAAYAVARRAGEA